ADGARFAWIAGGQVKVYGVAGRAERSLVALGPMEGAAAAMVESDAFGWQNRRVKEKALQWSGDGKKLLLKVKGDLFLVDTAAGEWRQLTKTREEEMDPKLSPDGSKVAYRLAKNLFVQDVASGKVTRVTSDGSSTRINGGLDWVYPEELDLGTAFWWSPDSRRIAYLQFDVSGVMEYPQVDLLKMRAQYEPERYPQAGTPNSVVRLGVVAANGGKTRWLNTGAGAEDLLARVMWMPNSEAVLVHRLTRTQKKLWLMEAPASGAAPRVVIEESDEAWINLADDLRVLDGGKRLVWSSERSGFRHLYVYGIDGKQQAQLTSGEWEMTGVDCVDETAGRVWFTSSEVSPTQRHLYSVGLDGAGKRRHTEGRGTHQNSFGAGCANRVDYYSSLVDAPRKTLYAGEAQAAVFGEKFAEGLRDVEILPTELLTFRGADGTLFHARLLKPAGFDTAKKYPALVQVYGGPGAQAVRDQWRGADWDQVLAHEGFVVWQMDNRGSAGRGHAFEKPLLGRFGKVELADQIEGVRRLVGMGFVDAARVGMNGWSYGGYMTLQAMLNGGGVFRAGISGAPVTDYRHYDTIYTERYLGLPQQNEEGYAASAVVKDAGKLAGKLLLIHNFSDDNVLFQSMMRMTDALQQAGKQYEFLLYPQKAHGVTGTAKRHMQQAMTEFLKRSLKGD
ncbi:MAG: S9 family peptidase, partial [Acidobacteria bacterium]|nr:S9 family peptidase [Acidobacteriota bacterium]